MKIFIDMYLSCSRWRKQNLWREICMLKKMKKTGKNKSKLQQSHLQSKSTENSKQKFKKDYKKKHTMKEGR